MKQTSLYNSHQKLSARFTEFAGWQMPVQYEGIIAEHKAVRESVGIFDVSHMGEILVSGENSEKSLQYLFTNDVSKLVVGKAQYTLMLNQNAGVVDDVIIYKLANDKYLLCVNAANKDKDLDWILKNNKFEAEVKDVSSEYAQIAVQGPKAREVCSKVFSEISNRLLALGSFEFVSEGELIIAATGYTGEDGYEIFCSPDKAESIWNALLEVGQDFDLKPIGLGARDTLRLEVCYPLHGHELGDDFNAMWSNVSWVIKPEKGEFIGKAALESKPTNKLFGFEVTGKGIVREGAKIFVEDREVGWVSSGTKLPYVGKVAGLGFLETDCLRLNPEMFAEVRGRKIAIRKTKIPFYKRD